MSILLGGPHTASVRALSPVSVFVFDDAAASLRANPEIAFHIGRVLAERLKVATTYLADLKQQYSAHGNHLGMVGEVLETLMHHQEPEPPPGPADPTDSRL